MYISNANEKVRNLIKCIEKANDIEKMRFLLYISNSLNNNQINNKNECNPNLVEDDDLIILNINDIGISNNNFNIFLHSNMEIYNKVCKQNIIYETNGNIVGIEYDDNSKKIIQLFERLNFEEKLDILSELFIRYDNNTYFDYEFDVVKVSFEQSGFNIAKAILEFKSRI